MLLEHYYKPYKEYSISLVFRPLNVKSKTLFSILHLFVTLFKRFYNLIHVVYFRITLKYSLSDTTRDFEAKMENFVGYYYFPD